MWWLYTLTIFSFCILSQVNGQAASLFVPNSFIPMQLDECTDENGFPASPSTLTPFERVFETPVKLNPSLSVCNSTTNKCIDYFEIHVQKMDMLFFSTPTEFWTYNGHCPGPTIKICKNRQSVVRFINELTSGISVHLHGSASLPPYDGWADDVTEPGQYKDYVYPNNRAATLWYHDHAVHHTAFQAYKGLAGQYWVLDCSTCADSFSNKLPHPNYDFELIISDKVFDSNDQLLYDSDGAHKDNLYGDHNLVNGIPWPLLQVEKRVYRFRFLDASVSRPYLIHLSNGAKMYIVSADGGYFKTVRDVTYFKLGVAERYDVLIDFSSYNVGDVIYLLNGGLSSVPTFCQSHLLVKFVVTAFNPAIPDVPIPSTLKSSRPLSTFVSDSDLANAANPNRAPDRTFEFGRSGGQWTINGKTWDDLASRIIATPKQDTVEIWKLRNGGGGWFHPVHIHLIDFLVAWRKNVGIFKWELESPKDVVFLGPGEEIRVVAKFGPNAGNYMFHCHNLVHEDNDMMLAFGVQTSPNSVPQAPAMKDPMSRRGISIVSLPAVTTTYLHQILNEGVYNVFYPENQLVTGYAFNPLRPWEVDFTSTCQATTVL
eukprot:TRINITY_DN1126_c0_g1_i1.p1 TRINITY_DN1126_c0_g1~~TRINITY_DN1126_c0_g1_i1.p1  ORF type:complete len:598 (+),score=93.81 TRINITY_DN1126_c0_g1_i1:66-1859(+)